MWENGPPVLRRIRSYLSLSGECSVEDKKHEENENTDRNLYGNDSLPVFLPLLSREVVEVSANSIPALCANGIEALRECVISQF